MKKILSILLCLLMLSLFGCKKKLFDYRNKYLGNYQFTVHDLYYIGGTNSAIVDIDTVIIGEGKVEYSSDRDGIYITFPIIDVQTMVVSKMKIEAPIYKNGSLGGCSSGGFQTKNNLTFSYNPGACSGALGAEIRYDVEGVKQ